MDAIETALAAALQPFSLAMLAVGVVVGLVVGVIPGVGGLFGLVVLVPLTYQLDPIAAVALLLGLVSVTTTSDTIPAVLIGVPGTAGAVTTVEDGHPLAQRNQASRAFGAAYSASAIGGVIGAGLLAASVPFMRPLLMAMKTPDFLAISVTGLLFVAFVSGRDGLKGVAAMLFGIMLSFVGADPVDGSERYTFGLLFLWDGLPFAAVFLGVFGLAELAVLLGRGAIAASGPRPGAPGMMAGFRDTAREWWLVLRCSSLGAVLGAVPGVGVMVIDWIAYGVASRNRRGGPPFGQGNIRGVIAPESANNAKDGGSLVPTLAFGVPGSAGMLFLLAALGVHGIAPGPDMLTIHLPLTYAMVFFVALANLLGAAICIAFTPQLARLATVPAHYIAAVALTFITIGAFQATGGAESTVLLLAFGVLGLAMKGRNWPRAAAALGYILGPSVERYFFLSYQLSGFDWLTRPSIVVTIALAAVAAAWSLRRFQPMAAARLTRPGPGEPLSFLLLAGVALAGLLGLDGLAPEAQVFPRVVAVALILTAAALMARHVVAARLWNGRELERRDREQPVPFQAAMVVLASSALITGLFYAVGHIAAVVIFVAGFILAHDRRRPLTALLIALGVLAAVWTIFDRLVPVPWPATLAEALWPA